MPLTPIMGLSIFIHVFIIVSHVILKYFFPATVAFRKKTTRPIVAYILSLVIIVGISGLVLTNGAYVVLGSLSEPHSNVRLANEYYASTLKGQSYGVEAITDVKIFIKTVYADAEAEISKFSLEDVLTTLGVTPKIWLPSGEISKKRMHTEVSDVH